MWAFLWVKRGVALPSRHSHTRSLSPPLLPSDAGKTGAGGTAASSARAATQMSLEEAHKILGAPPGTPAAELVRRYNHLFRANDECGSFYLTSKVYRARERIEAEVGPLEEEGGAAGGESTPPAEPGRVTDGRDGGGSSAQ